MARGLGTMCVTSTVVTFLLWLHFITSLIILIQRFMFYHLSLQFLFFPENINLPLFLCQLSYPSLASLFRTTYPRVLIGHPPSLPETSAAR